MNKEELEDQLIVGVKIKIGKQSAKHCGFCEGQIVQLVEGVFEYDNGLYTEEQLCPAFYDEIRKDFDSIYHLFGNDLEDFLDCEILTNHTN